MNFQEQSEWIRRGTWLALVLVLWGGNYAAWGSCTVPSLFQAKQKTQPGAEVDAEIGTWFGDHQQFRCASRAFEKAVQLEPDSSKFAWMLGVSLLSSGEAENAIVPLQHAKALDPKALDPHLALGAAMESLHRRTEAEAEWRAALAIDSTSMDALNHLSEDLLADQDYPSVVALLGPLADSEKLTPQQAANLSIAYSRSGMVEDAVRVLRASMHANPSSLPLVQALAGALVLQGRVQEAVSLLDTAAKQHPANLEIQMLYVRTLAVAHDPRAVSVVHTLLVQHPRQWELLYLSGLLRQQAGDDSGASSYLEQSVKLNPDYADSRYHLGAVLVTLKNYAAAKQQLEKAIGLGFNAPEVHFDLAKVLRALGDRVSAQQQLALGQQILKSQAIRTQAAFKAELGDQAEASGNLQQAVTDYRDALVINPAEPLLSYKLAMTLDKTGDYTGERKALEQTIQINPKMAQAQNQLGYLDFHGGNVASAIEHFQMAVQSYPDYAKAWMNLAAALSIESRWSEAKDALTHVLELDPANVPAKNLRERIDTLQAQR